MDQCSGWFGHLAGSVETGFLPDPERWHLWNDVLALLDLAAKRGGCEAWEDGDLLWIAIEGTRLIGAATTRLLADGRAELKHVAGVKSRAWRGQLEAQICDWARGHGCPVIIARGRHGWAPIVEKLGWSRVGSEVGLTLYEKVL